MTDIQKIHEASMNILTRTGLRVLHPEAVAALKRQGFEADGDLVRFPEKKLMSWVRRAPSSFDWQARDEQYSITVGGDGSVTAPTIGAPRIAETDGRQRPALMADYIKLIKLHQVNDRYQVNGFLMVQPEDCPIEAVPSLTYFALYTHTDKCLGTASGNAEEVEALMALASAAYGSVEKFAAQPRLLTVVNVNTPLMFDARMAETLMVYGRYGQPAAVTSAAMTGTCAPATLAGAIALANAEILAVIALAQVMNPGAPVLYGSQTTAANMRNGGIAMGGPEGALAFRYAADLARFYGLPSRAGGALTDAKQVDAQAGYESMMTYLMCRLSGVNLILHGAGVVDGYMAVSYEKLAVDFEIGRYVDRLMRGVEVNGQTLAEELIHKVGPGGHFLTQAHTLKNFRRETMLPELAVRGQARDSRQFEVNVSRSLEKMMAAYQKPPTDLDAVGRMKEILEKRGLSRRMLDEIENM